LVFAWLWLKSAKLLFSNRKHYTHLLWNRISSSNAVCRHVTEHNTSLSKLILSWGMMIEPDAAESFWVMRQCQTSSYESPSVPSLFCCGCQKVWHIAAKSLAELILFGGIWQDAAAESFHVIHMFWDDLELWVFFLSYK
jgi:hypothetical protein